MSQRQNDHMGIEKISVVRSSLLDIDSEVIVNAANTLMRGGGGIDGRIHMNAGFKMLLELCRVAPRGCKTGEVVLTPGFKLKQKWVIHTPGPIWKGGTKNEAELLAIDAVVPHTDGFDKVIFAMYGAQEYEIFNNSLELLRK